MRRQRTAYSLTHVVSSILMLLALAWLTVSTPFVYASQQLQNQTAERHQRDAGPEEGCFDPFSGTTEEKPERGLNTLSEEYLHDSNHIVHHFSSIAKQYKCHPTDLYFAYHPELLSPPPEA